MKMWMVRAERRGRLFEDFRDKSVVGVGWRKLGDLSQYKTRKDLINAVKSKWPEWKDLRALVSGSQLYRFVAEMKPGDRIVTYDPSRRVYLVGEIVGDYQYAPSVMEELPNIRAVKWDGEGSRDALAVATKNSLGAISTLFQIPADAAADIERALKGQASPPPADEEAVGDETETLEGYKDQAFEIIKDRVNRLDWDEMQELVASVLRAMGYKTRVSRPGPDRGYDIMASPDGFGFESPRIIVEVKHRGQPIGAQHIRGFLGGRHKDDKGLYVSTSGFTKDARYEADRANIPVMLLDIDDLVKSILRHYEDMDMDGQSLLPMKKIYWPA